MNKEQTLGIIRHFLSGFGSIAIYKGWIDESTMLELLGGVMTIVSFAWSALSKKKED
jgi:hypothetical protein